MFKHTRLGFIVQPDATLESPVFIEFGNKLQIAVYLHKSVIQVYVHSLYAIPYVVAYIVAELTKLGTIDIRGHFSTENPVDKQPTTKRLSVIRTQSDVSSQTKTKKDTP
jgi:hypothetical protein